MCIYAGGVAQWVVRWTSAPKSGVLIPLSPLSLCCDTIAVGRVCKWVAPAIQTCESSSVLAVRLALVCSTPVVYPCSRMINSVCTGLTQTGLGVESAGTPS
jgi:hypothetical protein